MRKEERGERRVGDEGGIETSRTSGVSISMSVPKLNEDVEFIIFRREASWGGSIDMVRRTGMVVGLGSRRGDNVDLDDGTREEGNTADDALGTMVVRRIVEPPGTPFVVAFVFFGLPNRIRFCRLFASSTSSTPAMTPVAASDKKGEVITIELDPCRRRFPFVGSAPPNQPSGAVTMFLMAPRKDEF